jgi:hypothetical protein
MAARILGDEFGFRSRIFSTVQWTNGVDRAVGCAVGFVVEEWTDVRQLAARPAIDALAFAPFGDGQHARHGPSDPGPPGIGLSIHHTKEHTPLTRKDQARI